MYGFIVGVLMLGGCLFLWAELYLCLRKKGCNNLYWDPAYHTLRTKEEKEQYKAKFDIAGMNRYGAKACLPLTVALSLMVPAHVTNFAFFNSDWYVLVVGFFVIVGLIRFFVAMPQCLGTRFVKKLD